MTGLRNFALESESNDMFIDSNGNWAGFTDRLGDIAQLLVCRLQTFLGEIPTNLDKGVDYHGIVFADFLTQQTKINELVRIILDTNGVQNIENFSISPNRSTGEISYDFTIKTDVGNIQFQDLL